MLDKWLARPSSPSKSVLDVSALEQREALLLLCSLSSLPFDAVSGPDVRTCFWEHREQEVLVAAYRDVFTAVPKTSSDVRPAQR